MRIIGGSLKGRAIILPSDYSARPTTDFAKEALFNILDNEYEFQDLKVLDLFGGTGAIAYEFASRGGARVYSIEMNRDNARFIREEASRLGLRNVTAVHSNVFDFLPICKEKFDIIFADPPYALPELPDVPRIVLEQDLLREGGLFIMEHSKANDFSHLPYFYQHRVYGAVNFSLFLKTPKAAERTDA